MILLFTIDPKGNKVYFGCIFVVEWIFSLCRVAMHIDTYMIHHCYNCAESPPRYLYDTPLLQLVHEPVVLTFRLSE